MLNTAASETVKLKNSTRCLLDRPANGYNKEIQTDAEIAEIAELRRRQTEERADRQTVKRRDTARLRTIK
jgi:hypothetical protein